MLYTPSDNDPCVRAALESQPLKVRNTYTLQMSEKINKTKQAVAGNTMRCHSAKNFFSFPGEKGRERVKAKSEPGKIINMIRMSHQRAWFMLKVLGGGRQGQVIEH